MKTLQANEKISVTTNRSGECGFSSDEFSQYINSLVSSSYGELITTANVTSQTPGIVPVLLTSFNTIGLSSSDITPDDTTDSIIITDAGIYEINAQFSFSGAVNSTFTLELYSSLNAIPIASTIKTIKRIGAGGDIGSANFTGLISLLATDEIGVFVDGPAGAALTVSESRLIIKKIINT